MTDTANTALWDTLRVIDRKATKPFQKTGGFRGTQIDPCWRIERMTQVFGPVGQGWGWEQVGIHFTDGLVFVCVRVWYVPAGEAPAWPAVNGAPSNARWTGPQWGGDVLTLKRGQNTFPNDEAPKMAMTDALGKALLSIGLAADVYMGLFDDSKYRDLNEREEDEKRNSGPKPFDTGAFSAKDAKSWAAEFRRRIGLAPSVDALNAFVKNCGPTLKQIGTDDPDTYEALKAGVESRRQSLTPSVAAE
ncbi:hypothetical protein [Azospirillum sp. TSO5]|uniref:hypothetical protein n=1 Tax=Azospirillum sp. TSO5 TaxID=716760 RepID=UPI000D654FE3|nr:hypothetical protein [Azospirillum sp. TSO5]